MPLEASPLDILDRFKDRFRDETGDFYGFLSCSMLRLRMEDYQANRLQAGQGRMLGPGAMASSRVKCK